MGCFIGPYFYGALAYADDIILLNPTVKGTKKMLQICEMYAKEHKILFNAQKSQYLHIYSKKRNISSNTNISFFLNDKIIPCVNNAKHLGHVLCNTTEGFNNCDDIIGNFNKSVNILMANFGTISHNILCKLFIQYCCSFYGISLCNIRSHFMKAICISWRKAKRRICKLPYRTHNFILPHLLKTAPLEVQIEKRIVKFYLSLIRTDNVIINFLARRCLQQTVSNMGSNIAIIAKKLQSSNLNFSNNNIPVNDFINAVHNNWYNNSCNVDDPCVADVCIDLMNVRDGLMSCSLSKQQCIELLHELCTH